jgi:hypothetical protein
MNPGPSEEAGATARSLIGAFGASPGLLAVIVLNVVILGGLFFGIREERSMKADIINQLFKLCAPAGAVQPPTF